MGQGGGATFFFLYLTSPEGVPLGLYLECPNPVALPLILCVILFNAIESKFFKLKNIIIYSLNLYLVTNDFVILVNSSLAPNF